VTDAFHGMIGTSATMRRLFDRIAKLAEDNRITVLIQGESGTGKELVAKAIHAQSARRDNNFVPVNCAAIPDDLLESELFGYVKGAFTGANQAKTGRIEYADGGTLFLDEIGDMKANLQAKLLRVLQDRSFEPVGGLKAIPVDVRIIAATHRNLEQRVNEGQFREDLYFRLSVFPLSIPSLRQRPEDIPLLLRYFIRKFGSGRKSALLGFDSGAMRALTACHWRGNVRELENLVQHMTILHGGEMVTFADLPEKYQVQTESPSDLAEEMPPALEVRPDAPDPEPPPPPLHTETVSSLQALFPEAGIDFNMLVNDFETRLILQALAQSGGNKKEAARLLNLKRTTLLEKMKKKAIGEQWQGDDDECGPDNETPN